MQGHAKKWFAMLRQQSRRVEVGDVYLDPAHGGFQPYATEEDPTQDWNAFWVHAREMFVGRSFEVDLKKHMLDGLPLTEQRTDNFVLDSRLFLVEFELARECLQRLDRPISQDDALLAFAKGVERNFPSAAQHIMRLQLNHSLADYMAELARYANTQLRKHRTIARPFRSRVRRAAAVAFEPDGGGGSDESSEDESAQSCASCPEAFCFFDDMFNRPTFGLFPSVARSSRSPQLSLRKADAAAERADRVADPTYTRALGRAGSRADAFSQPAARPAHTKKAGEGKEWVYIDANKKHQGIQTKPYVKIMYYIRYKSRLWPNS